MACCPGATLWFLFSDPGTRRLPHSEPRLYDPQYPESVIAPKVPELRESIHATAGGLPSTSAA